MNIPKRMGLSQGRADLSHPKNQHSSRARRRKMQRFLDKNFPIKKQDDEGADNE